MAETYGWAGKVLRVDLTAKAITVESTEKYKAFMGGTGLGWKVMWDEVPPGTKAFDAANKVIFAVGPATGSGSPCSGRTSVCSLWPVNGDDLPAAGHVGGHWGPELKYAGYDAVIVQGVSDKPVWLRIEDDQVTLEDASVVWGQGIYRTNNFIVNLLGPEAHVLAIGQAGENKSRLGAIFTDRSHRAGGVGGILGSKMLKAIGVRGTGAVKIAASKAEWKKLNKDYLSMMGANNQCVVARELQAWSEYSPGGTRWSGRDGVLWGSALPPVNTGTCPDAEHPTVDAPYPLNKIGLRTQKGYNDFGEEGLKRTVRMDGCHSCPIRCHIAADHPELENYGVSRYNMNTCMGNSGIVSTYPSTAGTNPQQNPMLLTYMSNHLEGDYGIWNDYGGWNYVFKWMYTQKDLAATIPDPATPGATIPNPDLNKTFMEKYLSKGDFQPVDKTTGLPTTNTSEYYRLRTTKLWNSGKSPFDLLDAADPRWLQFYAASVAANVGPTYWKEADGAAPAAIGKCKTAGTIGWLLGMGPPNMAKRIPELGPAFETDYTNLHMWKLGHTLHHSVESMAQIGGFVNVFQAVRDANAHTHHNFFGNGLPNSAAVPLKRAISQEIACQPYSKSFFAAGGMTGTPVTDKGESAGEWVYDLAPYPTVPSNMNMARASFIAQCIISYELQNSLTECNYTLPVWASPLKSRTGTLTTVGGKEAKGYRGDPELDVKVYNAVTGENLTQAEYEKVGLRLFTLWRVYMARVMSARTAGKGADLSVAFDLAPEWAFEASHAGAWPSEAEYEAGRKMIYDLFGYSEKGLPTAATLNALGLGDMVATLQAEGII
ncbi:MAG: aldehyde ferredoxin oxidoreductase N-terminal domain-containing protein [Anaeromyxobacter sp.]